MIDQINSNRSENIITIEDPIEFVHKAKKYISQREVGKDTGSFARALKSALRQDPDVILVGEMRDLETVSLALTACRNWSLSFWNITRKWCRINYYKNSRCISACTKKFSASNVGWLFENGIVTTIIEKKRWGTNWSI